jgi:hypothetical protein
MKSRFPFVLGLVLCCMTLTVSAQRYSQSKEKVSAADFPLTIHVSGSQFSPSIKGVLFVDASVEGRNVRMATNALTSLLREGDYRARLASDHEDKNGGFSKSYEILFADGSHHLFNVTGTSQ